MARITPESLMSLEQYAKARNEFRARVIAHKKNRTVHLGHHLTLVFEDELTIRYQIQEMLRVERIFEEDGINAELDAYNPLIPDGGNWKATLMIEYPDAGQRRDMLARLIGVEDRIWVQVSGQARVYAIADEDLERETEEKTSAVHFLRFELTKPMRSQLKAELRLSVGVDHRDYTAAVEPLDTAVAKALAADLAA